LIVAGGGLVVGFAVFGGVEDMIYGSAVIRMDIEKVIEGMEEPNYRCLFVDGPWHRVMAYLSQPYEEFCPIVNVYDPDGKATRRVAAYRLVNRTTPLQYRFVEFRPAPPPTAP
jgi:hypothetical protein